MGRHKKEITDHHRDLARSIQRADGVIVIHNLCKLLKCGEHFAKRVALDVGAGRIEMTKKEEADPPSSNTAEFKEQDDQAVITTRHPQVTSLEEALEFFEVDLDVWRPEKVIINQWGKGDLLQVKVWLERLMPKPTEDAVRALIERLMPAEEQAGFMPHRLDHDPDGHMLLISPVDHHFGKMAWAPETGDDYDLRIAEQLYVGAIDDALQKTAGYKINEIHMPVGSDLFHFDSSRGKTANETQMDVDSRPQKVFVAGCMAVIAAIERAAEVANTYIHFVPGNHDPTWSHHLCVVLWAKFNGDRRVTVDFGPAGRKYIEYGTNLILLTHGDMSQQNLKMLPLQLAVSEPERWGRTSNREIHIGHVHHQKEVHFIPLEEHSGVVVRTLPSLCGTDEWHYTKGFINNQRAMASFLYSFKRGYTGQFMSYANDILGRLQ